MEKVCRICGGLKNVDEFESHDLMKDGYRNECKKCSNQLYYNPERRRELNLEKVVIMEGEKKCRICNNTKDIKQFHLKRGTTDGHRSECKECIKNILKKYKEVPDFKEKRSEYDKQRYEKLKEKVIERRKQYRIEHGDEMREKEKEERKLPHIKEKNRISSIKYREKHEKELKEYRQNNKEMNRNISERYRNKHPHIVAWRGVLHSTLKRMGTKKEGHTIDMLGYSATDLKHHIEKQFTTGMNWENHGEWHIDHIISVVNFPSTTPVKIVCALSNLRPMWGTTREIDGITYEGNINKGSRSDF